MVDLSGQCGSSDLCTRCGLCCSGALFDWVPVTDEEQPRLRQTGLPIHKHGQEFRFELPCSKLDAGLCTIYADRPLPCRYFRCELLQRLDRGEVSAGEADEIVARAKTMMEKLRPHIEGEPGSMLVGKSWTEIFKRWASASALERREPSKARLVLDLTVLNRFLDRHFRIKGWNRVTEE